MFPNNWSFADEVDFNHTATLLLIEFIRQRFQRFLLVHSRATVYREVQEELCFRGFSFTIEKIRRKWNNLITTYRRIKEKNSEDPKVKIMWDYFQVWSHPVRQAGQNNGSPACGPKNTRCDI